MLSAFPSWLSIKLKKRTFLQLGQNTTMRVTEVHIKWPSTVCMCVSCPLDITSISDLRWCITEPFHDSLRACKFDILLLKIE